MRGLAISPDGQRLMLLMGRSQGEIRVMRIDGSGSRTLAAGRLLDPHWSSDGKCIYYIAEPAQARALVRHDLNGSVPPETVLQFKPGEVVRLAGISPGGRTALLFLGSRLHALGLDQSPVRAPEPLVLQDKSLHPWNHAIFSPDGKWIASPMSAGGMVFIPWPQSGTPLRAYGATTSLTFPFFHPSGKELCGHQEGILACSPIRFTADGPRLDEPQIIPAEARAFTSGYHDSQWAPDGSKILMLTTDQPERVLPTVLTDWSVLAENSEN
ncbi:MAG: hypothetical protein JNK87_37565 [Bryobacterales bacterium]|nr:hypothetical protein [Bryobacterales bacterium]